MAVQLSASYLRRSFQILAKLEPIGMSEEEAFDRAGNIIYLWATKSKFSNVFHGLPERKRSVEDKRDGNEIGVIFESDKGRFIFRCVHPDVRVPGRIWITDAELINNGDGYTFAVRLAATSLHSCTEEVPFSCPEFVRNIINNIGISDIIQIEDRPHLLSTKEEVDSFIEFVGNLDRRMPIVLLTPCFYIEDAPCSGYMMDATQMSHDLLGIAHVYQITNDANEYLTEAIGKQWSAYNGALRTYYPHLSWEESDCYQHPMLTQNSIRLRDVIGSDDSALCMHEIEGYVQNFVLAGRIDWEDSGIEFYLTAYQNYLRTQRVTSTQSKQELIDSYEKQLDQLQKQSDENLSLADSYVQDYETLRDETDKQRQKNSQLKAQITALRFQLKEATGKSEVQDVPVNKDYSEMSQWVDSYFPDRLVLLPRAVRSLKDAVYEDKVLVYKCLILLATKCYDYHMGSIDYNQFLSECRLIDPGLDEGGAITDVAAGMQGEEYFVQYCGQRRKLDRHLAKGSSKDQRYCLRIYFFWDDQEQVVVIGDLPHHLDTSAT